ncbi:hypothetical protein JW933_04485 [candidate division FCPU426 bacterium]|nr:hypothetical protein [candidate division FCPU426 bacterium]
MNLIETKEQIPEIKPHHTIQYNDTAEKTSLLKYEFSEGAILGLMLVSALLGLLYLFFSG